MASVYILYSTFLDTYYVGSCIDIDKRIEEHKFGKYQNSFTSKTNDWELFFELTDLEYNQARRIEVHIKKMKSRDYYSNLKKYPEMSLKLKIRFKQ